MEREKGMGFLVNFKTEHKQAFEALWEAFQLTSRPKNIQEFRTSIAIEDKLIDISADPVMEAAVDCPKCGNRFKFNEAPLYNFWRVDRPRTLKDGAEPIFFEENQFRYVKDLLNNVQPPQPRVRAFVALYDLLEDAEKNWKGDELKLRTKLIQPAAPAQSANVAAD